MPNGPAQTRTEFWSILKSDLDQLSLVIKAHHSIEAKLHAALEERLPRANRVELHRVAFLLKVDLLIGLGLFSPKLRHIFELANAIRNRFAHNPYAAFSEEDATKVRNAVRSVDAKYPCEGDARALLVLLLHVSFDYSSQRLEEMVAERLRGEALAEMMNDRSWQEPHPSGIELPPITEAMLAEVRAEMEPEILKRSESKLRERYPTMTVDILKADL